MKSKIVVGLIIVALLFVGGWRSKGQTNNTSTISYEYEVVDDPTEAVSLGDGVKKLNYLGAQGWELTAVNRVPNKPTKLYFKRLRR